MMTQVFILKFLLKIIHRGVVRTTSSVDRLKAMREWVWTELHRVRGQSRGSGSPREVQGQSPDRGLRNEVAPEAKQFVAELMRLPRVGIKNLT